MSKIIIVSNRLPVTVGASIKKSSGGLVAALDGAIDQKKRLWIGWPGINTEKIRDPEGLKLLLREHYQCVPVFLGKQEINDYYHGFSNSCLWPALHYFPHYIHYTDAWWEAYVRVNRKFAEEVAAHAADGDEVWIHDYHLFLLPRMLKRLKPKLAVGFFLHTPFPSYEIFRCLPQRKELLEGLLGADLLGFHTYGYMRHFRSSAIRLLKTEYEIDRIMYGGRTCQIGVFPIGINAKSFINELETRRFEKRKEYFRSIYAGRKLVLGVERLDYTKGIIRRLEAIEKFLSGPEERQDVTFLFISVPTRDEVKEYSDLLHNVQTRVGQINGQYSDIGYNPIHFIYKSIPFTDLCALYSIADVALLTPLIDGMNLVAKEYLACKTDSTGVLILSEFAGAAHDLCDAVIVNPYDIDDVAKSLRTALAMSESEKERRLSAMRDHVMTYDATHWAKSFLTTLSSIKPPTPQSRVRQKRMTLEDIVAKMKSVSRCGLFIDYDGTLREFEPLPQLAEPGKETLSLLKSLSRIDRLSTYIISGRKAEDLEKWLGDLDITLIAEHGFRLREPGHDWRTLKEGIDLSWMEKVHDIFTQYVSTTPGSFIERKSASIVWHYRRSEPEFGSWKAQQLSANLMEILANEPAVVQHGQLIVEVASDQIDKGEVLRRFLERERFDCVLCAGDDKTDETMFRLSDPRIISIKIGKGETHACHRLASPAELHDLLSKIVRAARSV